MGVEPSETYEPIVIKAHPQPIADQSRGDGVEHLAQREGAGAGDVDVDLLVVGGLADRRLVQRHPLLVDALGVAEVAAADDVVDETPPCRKVVEVSRGAQQQSIGERSLEMAVGALDRAILVADAGIVAGRRHAVMGAECFVALRQILLGIGVEITEGRRETVAAMLLGNAAHRPQGVLEPFRRQRDKTFAAEHDVGVFEAGKGQSEVIKSAIEDLAGDGHPEISHFREVRQSQSGPADAPGERSPPDPGRSPPARP